jgi:hypothetical protein
MREVGTRLYEARKGRGETAFLRRWDRATAMGMRSAAL